MLLEMIKPLPGDTFATGERFATSVAYKGEDKYFNFIIGT